MFFRMRRNSGRQVPAAGQLGSAGNVRRECVTDDVEMHFSYRFGTPREGADVGHAPSRRLGIELVSYRQRGVVGVNKVSEPQLQRDLDTFAPGPRYEFIEY